LLGVVQGTGKEKGHLDAALMVPMHCPGGSRYPDGTSGSVKKSNQRNQRLPKGQTQFEHREPRQRAGLQVTDWGRTGEPRGGCSATDGRRRFPTSSVVVLVLGVTGGSTGRWCNQVVVGYTVGGEEDDGREGPRVVYGSGVSEIVGKL